MSEVKHLLLLDIDGVLLQPGGYREAVTSAINYFTQQVGLPNLAPEEEILAFFESQGITNEWDIVPICLATILEAMIGLNPDLKLPLDWISITGNTDSQLVGMGKVDYRKKILEILRYLKIGKSPSVAIFEAGSSQTGGEPFPILSKHPLFTQLFSNTSDVERSLTTKIFQNLVLGSDVFQDIYGLEPLVVTSSYLDLFDRSNLSEWNCRKIHSFSKAGILFPVAYTARPSLPPEGVVTQEDDYSPEAEMALKLVGLEDIPLIAYGRLRYASQLFRVSTDLLIKPSPFQALAAISAAVMTDKNETRALNCAGKICEAFGLFTGTARSSGRIDFEPAIIEFISDLRANQLVIDIIEDSPIGIRAAKLACQMLTELNLSVTTHGWGVAQDASKKTALEEVGAVVYGDVNDALSAVFAALDPS
jgi:hypothetical protein